jgi:hypothetical protein
MLGGMATSAPHRNLPGSPFNASRAAAKKPEHYAVGDRVTHDRHGLGRVTHVEGDAAVHVDFGSGSQRLTTPTSKLHKL